MEFDILHLIYQSPVPLTTIEVIEALSDKHLRKYSSYQSFRNFVIKKLNWFTLRVTLYADGERYDRNRRWYMTDLGKYHIDGLIKLRKRDLINA